MSFQIRLNRAVLGSFLFGVAMVLACLLALTVYESTIQQTRDTATEANALARYANQLVVTTHTISTYPGETNSEQWLQLFGEVHGHAEQLVRLHANAQDLENLNARLDEMVQIYQAYRNTKAIESESVNVRRSEVLVDRLIAEAQQISELSYNIQDTANMDLRSTLDERRYVLIATLLAFVVGTFVLLYLMHTNVLRPLNHIRTVAGLIQQGNLQARCTLPQGDEIGDVAAAIDNLADGLVHRIHELSRLNLQLETQNEEKSRTSLQLNGVLDELSKTSGILEIAGRMCGVGGWHINLENHDLTWSEQVYRIVEAPTGYQPKLEEALQLYPPQARATLSAALEQAEKTGERIDLELPLITFKGRDIWVHVFGELIYSHNGQQAVAVGISGAFQDITERKAFEKALVERAVQEENNQRWMQMANSLPQLLWTCNAEGACDYLSVRWGQYTGKPVAELLDDRWLGSVHPEDRDALVQAWTTAVQTHDVFRCEFRIRRFDGEYRWFDTRAVPIFDDAGALLRWVGSNTDIQTDKELRDRIANLNMFLEKQVEQRTAELNATKRDLSKILDSVPTLIGYWDSQLRNKFANKAYGLWFNLGNRDITGIHLSELLPTDIYQRNLPMVMKALMGEHMKFTTTFPASEHLPQRTGLLELIPDFQEDGVQGFYVIMQDVTEIQQAKEEAFNMSQAKTKFIATVSHELRNPLNVVLGTASLIEQDLPPGDMQASFQQLSSAAESARIILDDLLDASAIERGQLRLERIPFELNNLIQQTVALYTPGATAKDLKLNLQLTGEDPAVVLGDPTRLKQIVQNLLSNAIKFTATGQVRCTAELIKNQSNLLDLQLMIQDSGIGMREDQLRGLFTPYYQADSATFRKFGGTGLGLSIVKALVEAMQGHIEVESTPEVGTTFKVRIPFAMQGGVKAAAQRETANDAHSKPIHCLVVDDEPINRKVLRLLLEKQGHQVDIADTGEAAIALCQHAAFDLFILDLEMPGLNGFETAQVIRSEPGPNQHARMVAFSGAVSDDMERQALSCGMNGFVTKPINPAKLIQLVNAGVREAV
ncbi:ATP-binding protein [Limnobacter humi]|uniref:histidine kinase n=1 Tax=Limnobacter humi TaxID=1778671 RepID=A0ABT1WKD7_9BURK|nr:ATP-binding protein [Limnobacter humi]MCQ8897337.1 ATP-binding protein [Limnobacter humi]